MLSFSETLRLHLTNAARQSFSKEKMRAKRHCERQKVTALRHFKPKRSRREGKGTARFFALPGMVYVWGVSFFYRTLPL